MAVKIRLARHGSKKDPFYRLVVADSKSPRDGRSIERLGTYNPQAQPSDIQVDVERAKHWLAHGAQPSHQARKILKISGAL